MSVSKDYDLLDPVYCGFWVPVYWRNLLTSLSGLFYFENGSSGFL
jgi:hypothetical protein